MPRPARKSAAPREAVQATASSSTAHAKKGRQLQQHEAGHAQHKRRQQHDDAVPHQQVDVLAGNGLQAIEFKIIK